ncbi:MAG TPA: hypothetical protein VH370_10525 [Humisphaera sp.]|jgi:hypothetical protein|nr:hypothetical protein [Humisphaera sp.]
MDEALTFVKPEHLLLKDSLQFNEKWVQARIAADPQILGLGDVVLKDKERVQPHAGRLDLLLQDLESNRRYEVELQLGRTDESHIIRTVEYWDIERKRYPQYDHCAVIVAEEITARFLNVISLFNGTIPLIAIQLRAVKIGGQIALIFTTVVNELQRGLVDEDEELAEVTDRAYWEQRASKQTLALVDRALGLIRNFAPELQLNYNKYYIGLARDGKANNFVVFRAKKNFLKIEPRMPQSEDITKQLEDSGLDMMDYDNTWGRYRVRVNPADFQQHEQALTSILKKAYDASVSG